MDGRKLQFLEAVIGPDGAQALAKAAGQAPDLEWAILPRVIMAWVDVIGHGAYEEGVPGHDDLGLKIVKGDRGYSGSIDIDDQVYTFVDASIDHVAGSVALSLGQDPASAPTFSSPNFAKLGKAIDVLVKSRTLRKIAQKVSGGAKGPGPAAGPIPPQQPQAPTQVQGPNTFTNGTAGSRVTLPGTKKKPTMKVTKAEAEAPCPTCGLHSFTGATYTGCRCLRDLAKSVRTQASESGYVLEFGVDWDADSRLALAEILGKY